MKRDASLPSEAVPGQLSGESNGRLHDLLMAMKDIHHALLMTENEAKLFQQICNSLKQVSYVKFVWIGLAEKGSFQINPVAFAGFEDGYLSSIKVTWDDSEYGKGPTGTAIKTGQLSVMRDTASDPNHDAWRKEALKRGYASSVALPLIHEGEIIGALNLYSERKDAFGDQEVQFLSAVAEDIALGVRSLRLQMNLHESEERFREAMEATSDGLWDWNVETGEAYYSPAYYRMLGYEPGELPGLAQAWMNLIHAEDREQVSRANQDCIENRTPNFAIEFRMRTRSGGWKWILGRGRASARDANGRAVRMIGTHEDITEHKNAEEALRRSEERYRIINQNMSEGVWLMGMNLKPTYISPSVTRARGYTLEELYALPLDKQVTPDSLKLALETLQEALSEVSSKQADRPLTRTLELEFIRKDGSTFLSENTFTLLMNSNDEPAGILAVSRDITGRKRMEEELKRHSAQLEQLVAERTRELAASKDYAENLIQTANAIVVELDNSGNIRVFNQAAERITGYTVKELEGRNWFEVIVPKDRYPEVWAKFERLTADGLLKNFENPILTKSGEERYIVWQNSEVHEQGQLVGTISFGIDITERKRMEEAVRESEKLFRNLVEDSAVAAAVFSGLQGDVYLVNRKFTELLGYTLKDVPDLAHWWPLAYPDQKYRDQVKAEWNRKVEEAVRTRNEIEPMELVVSCKDGSTRQVELHSSWVGDRIVSTLVDLTERKQMEEDLRSARERLEFMITSNPAVIYAGKPLADYSDFVLTYISDRVVAMLGFETREFIGHPEFWQRRVHPEDVRSVLAEMPRLWKEGQYSFDYRFLHKDGTYRWIREEAKAVRNADGKPIEVNGYWTDITERKHLEEALAKSQRLAAIGETSAMVGHDLRNPLQGIAGVVYLAKRNLESRKTTDRKAVTELLDTIQEQITYMDKIVSDLQDYARPLVPKLTETDLPNLIRQTLSAIKVPAAVKVSVEVEKAAQNVMIDPTLMRRTFTNLAINAIQAMPKRGKLTVRARSKGDSIVMTVEDTGVGIPKKNLAKLFSPFFTTKAKGQGLGLAVCKRLVEAQGGTITVKSKPHKGTAFTIKMSRGRREVAS